jgi:hypothetical protein
VPAAIIPRVTIAPSTDRRMLIGMIASIHPRRYDQGTLGPVRRFECEGHHTRIVGFRLLCRNWRCRLMKPSSGPAIKWIADLPLRIAPIASPCRPLARQWWGVVCLARAQE